MPETLTSDDVRWLFEKAKRQMAMEHASNRIGKDPIETCVQPDCVRLREIEGKLFAAPARQEPPA